MQKFIFYFFLYSSLSIVFSTCKKLEEPAPEKYFLLNMGYINVPQKTTQTYTFRISSTVPWKITTNTKADWLTVSPMAGGVGIHEITVTFLENTTVDIRSTIIDVFSDEMPEHKTISINQLGTEENILAHVSEDTFSYQPLDYATLEIVSNTTFSISADQPFVQFHYANGQGILSVPFILNYNLTPEYRKATITVSTRTKKTKQIQITQQPLPSPRDFPVVTPANSISKFKNDCIFLDNSINLKWGSSSDPLGGTVRYDVYLDTNPIPIKKIDSNRTDTAMQLSYFDLPQGKYYLQIEARTNLNAKRRSSNIIELNIFTIETYAKVSTVAGGNNQGNKSNQFNFSSDLFIDSTLTIYVADQSNYRVQKWSPRATFGTTIAGGNNIGTNLNQIQPHSISRTRDGRTLVSDVYNDRVMLFPANSTSATNGRIVMQSESHIQNYGFFGLFTHKNGSVYVCDGIGSSIYKLSPPNFDNPVRVAGGNGTGSELNQFNSPHNLFVDENETIYIADENNHRIIRWIKGASQGDVVAGGNGRGVGLNQFNRPRSVIKDGCDNLYIVDYDNKRIVKWRIGQSSGKVISSGSLNKPHSMLFLSNGDIYIADDGLHRIEKWER